jgi:hypothetical protein
VKHVGIVACSAEGAALCYQALGKGIGYDARSSTLRFCFSQRIAAS